MNEEKNKIEKIDVIEENKFTLKTQIRLEDVIHSESTREKIKKQVKENGGTCSILLVPTFYENNKDKRIKFIIEKKDDN
jgi:hypothetical protein